MKDNLLLNPWPGPFGGVPPWDQINPDEFLTAFDSAIDAARLEIDQIANQTQPANFENTIVALEDAGRPLARVAALFEVHCSSLNLGVIPELELAAGPKLSQHHDSILQNGPLFNRIETVYQATKQPDSSFSEAQKRLADEYFHQFVRQGARLNESSKQRLSAINSQLAQHFANFNQNVLTDERTFTIVADPSQLAGLPDTLIDLMAVAAAEVDWSSQQGERPRWIVANTRSAMDPVLTYAIDRNLRQTVWRKFYSRCDNGDASDNKTIITSILKLRAERAKLLGYETHAHWRLERQMARTPAAAMQLLMDVWPKAVQRVAEEVADMQAIADSESSKLKIEPWDYRFYSEKVRLAKYDLDLNEVKPYLQLERLREAMFWVAGQLFQLKFQPIEDVPQFHPDVRVWTVSRDENTIGLFYFDPYARSGKHSGAWMSAYRAQENITQPVLPLISNNCNFSKSKPGQTVLISWDDALTLFHEFGHALHGLCSNCRYPSQSGTSVPRDYVEFPSQIFEHWLSTPEVLQRFAVHFETGEPMPEAMLAKIEKAEKFNQGFGTVEFLASALIDMKLHLAGDAQIDVTQFESDTLQQLGMPSELVMRHRTPHFSHLFASDGYSAGYYSYLWADAITADAAEAFTQAGSFYEPELAKQLHDCVLSKGDTIDPAQGYRQFRGRDFDPAALLRKRGFADATQSSSLSRP